MNRPCCGRSDTFHDGHGPFSGVGDCGLVMFAGGGRTHPVPWPLTSNADQFAAVVRVKLRHMAARRSNLRNLHPEATP